MKPRLSFLVAFVAFHAIAACKPAPQPTRDAARTEQPSNVATTTAATEAAASAGVELPDSAWRGVCFAHSWEGAGAKGYGTDASAEALDHLSDVGVDWVSITPFGFMETQSDNVIRGEHDGQMPRGAESRERVERVVEQARQRRMKIMLKPHIWIRGGRWRGAVKPKNEAGELDWKSWWDSHDAWILHYAAMARDLEIEALVIGLELHTAVQAHPERLIELAAKVREIYDGHITYSANWNEPVPDDVWRALDSIGVQFYPPLTRAKGEFPGDEVRANLRKHLDDWARVAERTDRDLVITEVGYRAADIAVSHPNAWPEKMRGEPNPERQRDAYRVFFEELAATPRFRGVFLWKYFTDSETSEEGPSGFSPRQKPAEALIREAFARDSESVGAP